MWRIKNKLYRLNNIRKRLLLEECLEILNFASKLNVIQWNLRIFINLAYTIERRLSGEKCNSAWIREKHAYAREFPLPAGGFAIAARRVSTYIYSVFTFIALMYSRWFRPQTLSVLDYQASTSDQEEDPLTRGVSRRFDRPRVSRDSRTRKSREGQQSLDCDDGRWSALSILCNREIDAKHCRLRKVDGGLEQHEIAGSRWLSRSDAEELRERLAR